METKSLQEGERIWLIHRAHSQKARWKRTEEEQTFTPAGNKMMYQVVSGIVHIFLHIQ